MIPAFIERNYHREGWITDLSSDQPWRIHVAPRSYVTGGLGKYHTGVDTSMPPPSEDIYSELSDAAEALLGLGLYLEPDVEGASVPIVVVDPDTGEELRLIASHEHSFYHTFANDFMTLYHVVKFVCPSGAEFFLRDATRTDAQGNELPDYGG